MSERVAQSSVTSPQEPQFLPLKNACLFSAIWMTMTLSCRGFFFWPQMVRYLLLDEKNEFLSFTRSRIELFTHGEMMPSLIRHPFLANILIDFAMHHWHRDTPQSASTLSLCQEHHYFLAYLLTLLSQEHWHTRRCHKPVSLFDLSGSAPALSFVFSPTNLSLKSNFIWGMAQNSELFGKQCWRRDTQALICCDLIAEDQRA